MPLDDGTDASQNGLGQRRYHWENYIATDNKYAKKILDQLEGTENGQNLLKELAETQETFKDKGYKKLVLTVDNNNETSFGVPIGGHGSYILNFNPNELSYKINKNGELIADPSLDVDTFAHEIGHAADKNNLKYKFEKAAAEQELSDHQIVKTYLLNGRDDQKYYLNDNQKNLLNELDSKNPGESNIGKASMLNEKIFGDEGLQAKYDAVLKNGKNIEYETEKRSVGIENTFVKSDKARAGDSYLMNISQAAAKKYDNDKDGKFNLQEFDKFVDDVNKGKFNSQNYDSRFLQDFNNAAEEVRHNIIERDKQPLREDKEKRQGSILKTSDQHALTKLGSDDDFKSALAGLSNVEQGSSVNQKGLLDASVIKRELG